MPQVVLGRECGSCHACCVLPEIPGFKPAGERCKYLSPEGKCEIYEMRPQACRDFECGWKMDPAYRADERPERIGVMAMGLEAGKAKLNVLHELRRGALDSYHGGRLLKRVAKKGLVGLAEHGKPATLSNMRICGPARLVGALDAFVKAQLANPAA